MGTTGLPRFHTKIIGLGDGPMPESAIRGRGAQDTNARKLRQARRVAVCKRLGPRPRSNLGVKKVPLFFGLKELVRDPKTLEKKGVFLLKGAYKRP